MEDKTINKQKMLFMACFLFIGIAVSGTGYVSAYLKLIGLSSAGVGFFTSLRSILGIVAPIIWGAACDKLQTVKKPFTVCLIGTIILFPFIPFSETFLGLVSIAPWMTVFARFFYRPLENILSTWVTQMRHVDERFEYGKIKLFSSVGSLIGSTIYAYLMSFLSLRVGFYGVGISGLIALLIVPKLMDIKPEERNSKTSFKDMHLEEIIKNPLLISYYLFIIFANIPMCVSTNFMSYLLDEVNAGTNVLAINSMITSLVGIPLIFFSDRLFKKISPRTVLLVIAAVTVVGEFLHFNVTSGTMIIAISAGLSIFSAFKFPAQFRYCDEIAPAHLKSTAMMLNSTMSAFSTIISGAMGGYIIDHFGIRVFFAVSGITCLLALVLYMIFLRLWKKRH